MDTFWFDRIIDIGEKRDANLSEVEDILACFKAGISQRRQYAKRSPIPTDELEYIAKIQAFIAQYQQSDQLRYFKTNYLNYQYEGYAIYRDDLRIAEIITTYLIGEFMG